MINLDLPAPPTVNTYYRKKPKGGMYISARGKKFRREVQELCLIAGVRPLTGRLSLTIHYAPPDKRKRDIDNIIKAVQDALTHGGCMLDDEQIDELMVKRLPVRKFGAALITIKKIETSD